MLWLWILINMTDEREISFEVLGAPVPEGSLHGIPIRGKNGKTSVNLIHNNDKELKKYRKTIANVADEFHDIMYTENTDMGYEISIIFYIQRPESTKRPLPTVRGTGDLDKLVRAVLDAVTANDKYSIKGLFKDDSQVIRIKATKYYTEAENPEPKTKITLRKVLLPSKMVKDDTGLLFDDDI